MKRVMCNLIIIGFVFVLVCGPVKNAGAESSSFLEAWNEVYEELSKFTYAGQMEQLRNYCNGNWDDLLLTLQELEALQEIFETTTDLLTFLFAAELLYAVPSIEPAVADAQGYINDVKALHNAQDFTGAAQYISSHKIGVIQNLRGVADDIQEYIDDWLSGGQVRIVRNLQFFGSGTMSTVLTKDDFLPLLNEIERQLEGFYLHSIRVELSNYANFVIRVYGEDIFGNEYPVPYTVLDGVGKPFFSNYINYLDDLISLTIEVENLAEQEREVEVSLIAKKEGAYQETYFQSAKNFFSGLADVMDFLSNVYLSKISLTTETVLFEDDFESYAITSYPAPDWYNVTSGVTAYVSTEQAYGGTKSCRLEGRPYWARCDVVSVTPADKFYYEVCVYMTSAGKRANVGFQQLCGNMLPRFNAVFFDQNDSLWFTGPPNWHRLSGSWSPNTWYKVRVELDFNSLKGNVYINDELRGENLDIYPAEFEWSYCGHVILNQFGGTTGGFDEVGNSVIYIDDVRLFQISGEAITDCDNDGLSNDLELATGTNPFDDDTDDDGLLDGPGSGEDVNANGSVDPGETDPRNPDTDGDGILDGTELGLSAPEGSGTNMNVFVPDADPSTVTDPTDSDTDGDGIPDGEEDKNKNGRVDPGESNPNVYDITAVIDIDPNTLNLVSQGKWITCYIELEAEYDPNDIEIPTVKLNDTVYAQSTPTQVDDYDGDSILDLMVKFDRSEVEAILNPGESVEIIVRGWVQDNMFFGYDTIRVLGGENPKTSAEGSQNNPKAFTLLQNYPNPFNPETRISFVLPQDTKVSLVVFNLVGQKVRTLFDGQKPAGHHSIHWDGRNQSGELVASGIYLYQLKAEKFVQTRKMVLLR